MIFGIQRRGGFEKNLEAARNTEDSVIIDVRTAQEYKEGHLPDSINIPLDNLEKIHLDKRKKIFVHCLSGGRSEQARLYLRKRGYESVVNMGGISGYRGEMDRD